MRHKNRRNKEGDKSDRNLRTSPSQPHQVGSELAAPKRESQDAASIRRDEKMIGAKRMPRKGDDENES